LRKEEEEEERRRKKKKSRNKEMKEIEGNTKRQKENAFFLLPKKWNCHWFATIQANLLKR
jgi:hypothetical protein